MDSDEIYDGPWQFDPRYDQYPGYDYTKDPRVVIVERTDTRDKDQEKNNDNDDGMQGSESSGRSGSGN
ncbi:T2SSG domain-containing protein [Caenorhabditis elegans]|uniref:T2SSG domain-containing protein n=1 Tax=Caenorhabditis elegans TaxID=6239 RepID=Q56VZ3_CAEEL|nr:T2SSG domain-containing protein [Caenorhabditis elegans]CAI79272.2 T2SSG domain-containing protein [Caenorhabditis elegans]|eukprot:NP_001024278.2 Uncharacterized protein CELE_Y68A4A.13 [Caenorhabditis elegans]